MWYMYYGPSRQANSYGLLTQANLLNNIKIVTGGMEQNRRDKDETGENIRTYSFQDSPKKFYANGINGMLIITYKF